MTPPSSPPPADPFRDSNAALARGLGLSAEATHDAFREAEQATIRHEVQRLRLRVQALRREAEAAPRGSPDRAAADRGVDRQIARIAELQGRYHHAGRDPATSPPAASPPAGHAPQGGAS